MAKVFEQSGLSQPAPPAIALGSLAVPFRLGYRRWLDGLRGVAILLVMAFHFRLLKGGSTGVDLFFVLSGFLITALLVEEWSGGGIHLSRFYLRRIARLLPGLGVLLLVFTLSTLLLVPPAQQQRCWRELLVVVCYVANWPSLHGVEMSILGHAWSLSLEEQFYLLWPLILLVMLRWNVSRQRILTLVSLGILVSALWRIVLYHQLRTPGSEKMAILIRLYMGLDTRADALLVGCLVGLLAAWRLLPDSKRFSSWIEGASVSAVAILAFCVSNRDPNSSQNYHGLFTLVALASGVLIVRFLVAPHGLLLQVVESWPLVATGRISYGLYLFHIPVLACFDIEQIGWRHPMKTALAVVLSYAAALVSYFLVERPFLRLKERLGPNRPTTEAAAPRVDAVPYRKAA